MLTKILNSLFLLTSCLLVASCGGGGSASTPFNFAGDWLSRGVVQVDNCDSLGGVGSEVSIGYLIEQQEDSVSVTQIFGDKFIGVVDGNSFVSTETTFQFQPQCPDGVERWENPESSLSFEGAEENLTENVNFTVSGICGNTTCRLSVTGPAIRAEEELL